MQRLIKLQNTLSRKLPVILRNSKTAFSFRQFHSDGTVLSRTVGLNEEQRGLLALAEDFAEKEMKPHAAAWDRDHHFPVETLRKLASLGLAGMFVREDVGGSALSRLEGNVVIEALASGCVGTTAYLTIHNMCLWMIDTFGTQQQRTEWLPQLLTLERFTSYCLTEPGSGSDSASLRTTAVRSSDGDFIINGTKMFISGGSVSDDYLVMCRTGGEGPAGISCIKVSKGTPGLSFGKLERKMGWNCQPTCAVIFEDCRVPASNVLGGVGALGTGFKMAMRGLDGGRLSIASCSVGAAHACFGHAMDHVAVREQFKKPLIANQSIQFTLSDMAQDVVTARTMVRQAATLLDAKDPSAKEHCAMAKRLATDLGFKVCNQALQLHGGYGYLNDYPVERFVRDVRVNQILEGTNQIMQLLVARSLTHASNA